MPKILKLLLTDIQLPDVERYSPKFLSFIIETSPTPQQLRTYITLYHLADLGIPFPYVEKSSLIQIIHEYTDVPKATLKNQFNNTYPIHKRLATIYSFSELDTVFDNFSISNVPERENLSNNLAQQITNNFAKNIKTKEPRVRLQNLSNIFKI